MFSTHLSIALLVINFWHAKLLINYCLLISPNLFMYLPIILFIYFFSSNRLALYLIVYIFRYLRQWLHIKYKKSAYYFKLFRMMKFINKFTSRMMRFVCGKKIKISELRQSHFFLIILLTFWFYYCMLVVCHRKWQQ